MIVQHSDSTHKHVGRHLASCPDCIVWMDTFVTDGKNGEARKGKNLYLFSKFVSLHTQNILKMLHLFLLFMIFFLRYFCISINFSFLLPIAKTGTLDESHLEMFKKQAACHGFLMEFHFGENTGKIVQHLSAFIQHPNSHNACNVIFCLSFRLVP